MTEEEKAALIRGGFDLTEHKVLRTTQLGPLSFVLSEGGLKVECTYSRVSWFLNPKEVEVLKEWLDGK